MPGQQPKAAADVKGSGYPTQGKEAVAEAKDKKQADDTKPAEVTQCQEPEPESIAENANEACNDAGTDKKNASDEEEQPALKRRASEPFLRSTLTATPFAKASARSQSEPPISRREESDEDSGPLPTWIVENQRFTDDPPPWVFFPTLPDSGDPPPWQEMIIPEEGVAYVNVVPVSGGGGVIGRLISPLVVEKKGRDGRRLYAPVVDDDTDEQGWFYATAFARLDEPRDGGRTRKRTSDKVRRRLWRYGNELGNKRPKDAIETKGLGSVLENAASAPLALARILRRQIIVSMSDQLVNVATYMRRNA